MRHPSKSGGDFAAVGRRARLPPSSAEGLAGRGSGWEWVGVDGSGWEWMGVDGSGWEWVGVDGSGWEWMGVDGSGWEWIGAGRPRREIAARGALL